VLVFAAQKCLSLALEVKIRIWGGGEVGFVVGDAFPLELGFGAVGGVGFVGEVAFLAGSER